ncbi:hypothetical protein PMM47T1_13318 [Pseudomonas sp. M47T1]|uniref:hypothetical protein n=1 Tax=Pseudomonas sp. M47T1 TaxID=1179778 RepID=UPI0002607D9C|nr:hypothetical protein [Pseudomonas sp. M47T1]EIK96274.1 hypothetical protein PMM47T1_13318 [Pseudomonas sp. M47T1]
MADKYIQVTASTNQKALIKADSVTKLINTTSWRAIYQGNDTTNGQVTNTLASLLAALNAV